METTSRKTIDNRIFEKMKKHVENQISTYNKTLHCYCFELCFNPLAMKHWFIRFIKADISNPDHVDQSYTYFCFSKLGEPLLCSPIFDSQEDSALFFDSMVVIRKYDRL